MPQLGHLRAATKDDLLLFLKQLCAKHPEIRDDVRAFSPDVPVDKMISDLVKAEAMIGKKLPWDRYGRGNGDTYAYNRVRPFITSFAKLVAASIKTVEQSSQREAVGRFVAGCRPLVDDMHEFHSEEHNAAKSRLQAALDKLRIKFHLAELPEEEEDEEEEEETCITVA